VIRWILIAALAACSNLQPLDQTCGNGVIDPGEDCDSTIGCRQCSIECSAGCPDGFTCGVDTLCHAPGGTFRGPTAVLPFTAQGFGVTDTNGDGYGDVLALGGTSMIAYYGDAAGQLATTQTQLMPFMTGAPAVAELDPDATLDLVVPNAGGLLAFTSQHHVPTPYPFPIEANDPDPAKPDTVAMIPLASHYLALLQDNHTSYQLTVVDANTRTVSSSTGVAVCASLIPSGQLDPDKRSVYLGTGHFWVALTSRAGAVCEIEINAAASGANDLSFTITSRTVAAAGSASPQSAPVISPLDFVTPSCPAVLFMAPNGMTVIEHTPGGAPGTCTTSTTVMLAGALGSLVAAVPLASSTLGLVFTGGIAKLAGTTLVPVYIATRPINAAHVADVNHDTFPDVVATSATLDDLDVLMRTGDDANPGFLDLEVDTVGIPRNVTIADFNGDTIDDITYTERLTNGERLMIAFGGHDQLTTPALVSTFTSVVETAPVALASVSDPNGDQVADLLVIDRPDPQARTLLLTVLSGSPQRTLLPIFDPRTSGHPASYGFRGAVAGVFETTPQSTYKDLFAFESRPDPENAADPAVGVYLITPDEHGAMQTTLATGSNAFADCMNGQAASDNRVCIQYARFVPWRPDPAAASDLIFGVDRAPQHHVVAFDPARFASAPIMSLSLAGAGIGVDDPAIVPHEVYVADIDGDGFTEAVMGYAPTDEASTAGGIVSCSDTTGTLTCSPVTAPELAGWACGAASPGRVVTPARGGTPPAPVDLVALCRRDGPDTATLFRIHHEADGFHAEALLDVPRHTSYVELADVTGDGIDDVLAYDPDPMSPVPLLKVYPQCDSRNLAACAPPVTGAAP